MQLKVLPTDVNFTMSRDSGPGCLCSRCLLPIVVDVPIRIFPESGKCEFRYHPRCLDIKTCPGDWGDNYENLPY